MSDRTIHIASVEVENFHRIKAAEVQISKERGLIIVTGKNASGKSSFLKSIASLFFGGRAIRDDDIVHAESKDGRGFARVELTDGTVIRRSFSPKTPKGALQLVTPDGGKYGQTKLNEWVGPFAFDLMAFYQMRPEHQREALYSLSPDPDFMDRLNAAQEEIDRRYRKRTPVRSELQVARKRAANIPMGDRPEPINVSEEMGRLEKLREVANRRQNARRDLQGVSDRAATLRANIDDIKERLQRAEEDLKKLEVTERVISEGPLALPDPTAEIQAIEQTIARSDEIRRELQPWLQWEEATEAVKRIEATDNEMTEALEEARAAKRRLFAESGVQIDGLSFSDEGEILLNGLSLEAASGMERIRFAANVAFAANSDLKACLIDAGDDLDLEAMEELDRVAKEKNFQVLITRIGIEGPGEIVVEDGVAKSAEKVPA